MASGETISPPFGLPAVSEARVKGADCSLSHNAPEEQFENELPPIPGLDAVGIQDENRKAIDEVLAILHAG